MYLRKISLAAFAALFMIVFVIAAQALPSGKCDDGSLSDADGYKIRAVKINVRYLPVGLPPKGTAFTRSLESRLLNEVRDALAAERNRENTEGSTLSQLTGKLSTSLNPSLPSGSVRVSSIQDCVEIIAPETCRDEVGQAKCVDITVSARTLRFSLNNPAENLLNAIPRSSSPTILSNVPKPLLIFNPTFGVDYDGKLGLSQNVEVATNLLDLNELLKGKPVDVKSTRLDVKAGGRKSLNNTFYDTNVAISVSKFLPSRLVEKISGTARFSASNLPNGDAEFFRNAFSLNGGVLLKPGLPLIKSVVLEGGYARANNRFISDNPVLSIKTRENDFHFRVLFNGQIKHDVLRVGFWTDGGETTNSIYSYKRFAGLAGYAKEFGRGNQTFGLEMMLGAGKVSGDIPTYAYFYGSNELKNFIYEADDSSIIQKMPAGPLIRSFGSGQAANNGGAAQNGSNSYWHFNFNLSVPVAKWSSPLIPNEPVNLDEDEPDPNCPINTIRDLIKCQAASGETILGALYRRQGLSRDEAIKKAKQEFKGINSAIGFLVDRANLYSVKPLFMFDAAKFNGLAGTNKIRLGAGGGLQLNIVIAKFEAGYMRTINSQPGDSKGNFIMRLYFQNLF